MDPFLNLAIEVDNRQRHLSIHPPELVSLARRVLSGEGIASATISLVLVDDALIREINREHLGHDWSTDVITFPLSLPGELPLEAELILSTEMALTTASEAGTDPRDELALYLVHGLLHLCGFDDRTERDAQDMRGREAEVLDREGIVNTFSLVGPGGKGAGS